MDLIEQILKQDFRAYLESVEGHIFIRNKTLCPFHNDHIESMSVNQKNGSWVWYCHSCKEGGNIIHYEMKKHELTKVEAIKKLVDKFSLKATPRKPKVVAEYSYTDEQGNEIYKILRFSPKLFKADRNMTDIRQVLYRLPEVIKAETVWLVEGEKDVDNLRKLGLTVTTNPFGVSNWRPEFAEPLKGKTVYVCLDKGRMKEGWERASTLLRATARRVKVLDLPDLEAEQDISDWLEKHDSQTTEDLKQILEGITEKTPDFSLETSRRWKNEGSDEPEITNPFLLSYMDSISKITDAPRLFILFSGLGLLSGLLNRHYFYYPRLTPLNLYFLLLAPSTFYRKSVCIDIASDYLAAVNSELLLPESFTSEALLGILSKQNRGLLTWRELIQVKEFQFGSYYNRGLPSLLTDLFDFKEKIRRFTKAEGEIIVERPIISILAAGISTWLVEGLRKVDFQGGIWTRFLFIPAREDETRKFTLPNKFKPDKEIIMKLRKLGTLEPKEMDFSQASPLLQKWGQGHLEQSKSLSSDILRANFQRLEVALLKIACLLQLAKDESNVIESGTFMEAIIIIEYLKRILPAFFDEEIKFSEFDKTKARIKKLLKKEGSLKWRDIIHRTGIESNLAEKAINQLLKEGTVKTIHLKPGTKGGRPGRAYIYTEEIFND